MNIWFSLLTVCEALAVLLAELLFHHLHSTWQVYLIIFSALLFLSAFLFWLLLDEMPLEYQDEGSFCEQLEEKWAFMKQIMKTPNQSLVLADATFILGLFFITILWFPYYFSAVGLDSYSTNIVLSVTIISIVAPIIF